VVLLTDNDLNEVRW